MTTITFDPPVSASAPLDGSDCLLQSFYNYYANRYYLTITNQSGTVMWHGPVVESVSTPILLAFGVFKTSTIIYHAGKLIITP